MTPRNIRAHQSRGLCPPPVHAGRVAHYGAAHESALLRVKELQSRGYNLAAITALVMEEGQDRGGMQRAVLAPILDNDEVVLSWQEIAGMYDQEPSPERFRRAVDSGTVRVTADGRGIAPTETWLRAARGVLDPGMPFAEMCDMMIEVVRDAGDIARRFVELCLEC